MKRKVQIRRHLNTKVIKAVPRSVRHRGLEAKTSGVGEDDVFVTYVSASEAKNRFATVLENVSKGQKVFITKHNSPKAVVISVEKFKSLSAAATSVLDALAAEFDTRLARMQAPKAQIAMEKAFNASTNDLGKASIRAARR